MRTLTALAALCALAHALPSCEDDIGAHCIGDDMDMSSEGISACLSKLSDRSDSCSEYLKLMDACAADIGEGGVCASAHADGEAMPCILQRTKPEALSSGCQDALPKNELKGLAKFWADGKRPLTINEIADLSNDDKDIYNRWQKRKKGKKTEKDRERDYAVKAAKKERTMELIKIAVKEAVAAAAEPNVAEAIDVAKAKEKELLGEDMTGTLKPLGTYALENLARDAYKAAVKAKKDEL